MLFAQDPIQVLFSAGDECKGKPVFASERSAVHFKAVDQ